MPKRCAIYLISLAGICAADLLAPAGAGATSWVRQKEQVADARSFRHCHNTPRRTYCHTREVLPVTVPPPSSNAVGRPSSRR